MELTSEAERNDYGLFIARRIVSAVANSAIFKARPCAFVFCESWRPMTSHSEVTEPKTVDEKPRSRVCLVLAAAQSLRFGRGWTGAS